MKLTPVQDVQEDQDVRIDERIDERIDAQAVDDGKMTVLFQVFAISNFKFIIHRSHIIHRSRLSPQSSIQLTGG